MTNWKMKTTFLYHSTPLPSGCTKRFQLKKASQLFKGRGNSSNFDSSLVFEYIYILNNLHRYGRQHTDNKDKSISFQKI